MIYAVQSDLIPLLQNLVAALQPFADANEVNLRFKTQFDSLSFSFQPDVILSDLSQLICRVITFTPQGYDVTLEVRSTEHLIMMGIRNTGADLEYAGEITSGLKQPVRIIPNESRGTFFEVVYKIGNDVIFSSGQEAQLVQEGYEIPPFFKIFQKHLQSHFEGLKNLEKAADGLGAHEGVFLRKVNAILLANLDREGFDTETLGRAMALSRTQLHRRLKPLAGMAPARYIRYMRLQQAKEMLEEGELTISEAAFRTGFMNPSHFSRSFREQYGFNPSEIKHK
ncbi:MAG: helix-turn-helix transcriptional regulator [Saprospirales bacterium]|nr:helix-turn-helix transcriptional regulator [Saprospirales bacterium]